MAKFQPFYAALEQLAKSRGLELVALGLRGTAAPPAPMPEPIKPVPLPDPEDPARLAERRRQLSRAASSGRASTTLRAQEDYSTDKTGVA